MVDKMATETSGGSSRDRDKVGNGSTVGMELAAESSSGGNGDSSNRGEGASLIGTRVRIMGLIK